MDVKAKTATGLLAIGLGGTGAANAAAQQDILERTVRAIKSPICYNSTAAAPPDGVKP